jgi:hypothetical protein
MLNALHRLCLGGGSMEISIKINIGPDWLIAFSNVLVAISNFFVAFHH